MEQRRGNAAGAVALTLGAAALLSGCAQNGAGKDAAARMSPPTVKFEAGASDDYRGIASPTLETIYVQSPEEEKKYGEIMQDILENGIDTERELQTGL